MNKMRTMVGSLSLLTCICVTPAASAATTYLVDVDPNQSSVYVDGTDLYPISGSLRVIVDGATIRFENHSLSTSPTDVGNELLIADIGSYDGLNFEYTFSDVVLPTIGNMYAGTFDGNALFLYGVTFDYSIYDYSITSATVTAVPVPGALALLASGLAWFGFGMRRRTR